MWISHASFEEGEDFIFYTFFLLIKKHKALFDVDGVEKERGIYKSLACFMAMFLKAKADE